MEKRVLLAIVLSFVVLYGYQAMFPPRELPAPTETQAPATPGVTAAKPDAATPHVPPSGGTAPAGPPPLGAQPQRAARTPTARRGPPGTRRVAAAGSGAGGGGGLTT